MGYFLFLRMSEWQDSLEHQKRVKADEISWKGMEMNGSMIEEMLGVFTAIKLIFINVCFNFKYDIV